MELTRNGQRVRFEIDRDGDLVQTSTYRSKAGLPMETGAFAFDDLIVIASTRGLATAAANRWRGRSITKGVEVVYNGRHAVVIRTTTLNVHGPMADLIYTDTDEIGCALIEELVRADEVAALLPEQKHRYTTVRVDDRGDVLPGTPERTYEVTTAWHAAGNAASAAMLGYEYASAEVHQDGDIWTYRPSTGAPVRIRVVRGATALTADEIAAAEQEVAEQVAADEHEQEQLDAMGKHEESLAEHGMGLDTAESLNAEALADIAADEPQTWNDVDVVARTEQLHPSTHPYRTNEVVEYVGPSGIGSWVHGPLHFRRMVESDVAEIMTMSGPQRIEIADLRRPASNIAVELTPDDVARLFQALAQEAERLAALGARDTHTDELRDRFAALHP